MTTSIDQVRESATIAFDLEQPMHRDEAIFGAIAEILVESGHFTLPEWAPLSMKSGRKINTVDGYELDEDLDVLTIFRFLDCHERMDLNLPWERMPCPQKDIVQAVAELEAIARTACEGSLPSLDAADPASDMCRLLKRYATKDKSRISLCIWTTGELSKEGWKRSDKSEFHTAVWDATRICNALDSGHDTLAVSFQDFGGIDCLLGDADYQRLLETGSAVLLGKIPGECLANLYFEHRTRLLQQNVRAFLSFGGGVNRGIKDTIKTEPNRFLAYNNGIAVTASAVTLERQAPGVYRLLGADDFQIVNGGQTTAALMHAQNDSDLKPIQVAMKLTVVRPEDLNDLVPKISRFANLQNKIQEADFESNNPWLVKVEAISRKIEASKDDKSDGQPLKWYFERVRGQYNVDLGKQNGAHQKAAFKAKCPSRSRFSKTDLATVAMAWEAEPQVVSLGRQKCFGFFIRKLIAAKELIHSGNTLELSEEDFRRLACLLILRREAIAACRELAIGAYRANVIAYASALISVKTKSRLPFSEIWNTQALPDIVLNALRIALKGCDRVIQRQANACVPKENVTEFAKKAACWKAVLEEPIQLGLDAIAGKWDGFSVADTLRLAESIEATEVLFRIRDSEWQKISSALKDRIKNNPSYPGVAATMAKYAPIRKKPSDKQARLLAKGLLKLKAAGVDGCGLDKLTDKDWVVLESVAARR